MIRMSTITIKTAAPRTVELGATPADIGQSGREGWTVLRDPGGQLFCILQDRAAHDELVRRDRGTPTPL